MKKRVLVSWSSGKDSAWMLYQLQQKDDVEIIGLLTSFNSKFKRVAMHAVRQKLVQQQAASCGLPLFKVDLPWPCSNEDYENIILQEMSSLQGEYNITHVAYGDLFLEEIQNYRVALMAKTTMQPLFPIWNIPTNELAVTMVESGLKAYVTCVDPKQLAESFAGEEFNMNFLKRLPAEVDPCGENGEFHTFTYAGPMFNNTIKVSPGEILKRDGFIFTDLITE